MQSDEKIAQITTKNDKNYNIHQFLKVLATFGKFSSDLIDLNFENSQQRKNKLSNRVVWGSKSSFERQTATRIIKIYVVHKVLTFQRNFRKFPNVSID